MARLIGTAGHVDHGKTTLIRALTGIDADRLPEEQARGMTIDVGFAYIELPEFGRVSIVDVPGHERFIHNMLVGALGIDVALLCVAADAGVMPQTREHLDILRLLPVQQMVVALTRADLADGDMRALVTEDVQELLANEERFKRAPIIPVSAVSGEGLDALRGALTKALSMSKDRKDGPWYLPVDRSFTVKGHGTVVTGTLAQGKVRTGESAFLEPGHTSVRVRSLQSHDAGEEIADAGTRTAMNLGGVKLEDVHRGMAVGCAGALFETRCLDARITWLVPPKHGQRVRVSVGAEEAMAKAFLNDHDPSLVQLRLEIPVAVALNQPLILRRYSPMELLGGGEVVVPQSQVRRKTAQMTLASGEDDRASILTILGDNPDGVMTDEICRRLGRTPQALGQAFEGLSKEGKIYGFAGNWLSGAGLEACRARFLAALSRLHEGQPLAASHPREKVLSDAGLKWAGKPLDRLVSHLSQQGDIVAEGTNVRSATFTLTLSPKQGAFLDRVVEFLNSAGLSVPFASDIARALGVPPQAVEEILRLGAEAKRLVRVAEGIYYTKEQIEGIKETLRSFGEPFPATRFRDATGSSRKYVIPLLEYFDSIGFTLRQGDLRVVR